MTGRAAEPTVRKGEPREKRIPAPVAGPVSVAAPLLRGQSHAVAAVVAVGALALLMRSTHGVSLERASLLLYGVSSVALFTVSALYHLGRWPPRGRAGLRRLDHAMICVMIAAGATPLAVILLTGWWRVGLLAGVWGVTLGDVALLIVKPPSRPRRIALYGVLSALALLATPMIVVRLGFAGAGLPALAAALCIAGAIVYTLRRPTLWPRIFGYHELFHLAVIAAHVVFFVFIVRDVAPLMPGLESPL